MAFAFVTKAKAKGTSGTITTSAVNTTGADLIVAAVGSYFSSGTFSDSLGNSYTTILSEIAIGAVILKSRYCVNPTVGASHTFSINAGYPCLCMAAFSGVKTTSPLDQTSSASSSSVTSIAAGSITPTENNELVVSMHGVDGGSNAPTCGGGFTVTDSDYNAGTEGSGLAYLIQTSSAAANPSWTWSGSCAAASIIASFKAAAVASGSVFWAARLDGLGSGGPFFRGGLA